VLFLNVINILQGGETVWKIMNIQVGQERSETNTRSKKLLALVHAKRSHTLDEVAAVAAAVAAAAEIGHGTCHKILSYDLNMGRVTSIVFYAS
jgi:hypothetical protein